MQQNFSLSRSPVPQGQRSRELPQLGLAPHQQTNLTTTTAFYHSRQNSTNAGLLQSFNTRGNNSQRCFSFAGGLSVPKGSVLSARSYTLRDTYDATTAKAYAGAEWSTPKKELLNFTLSLRKSNQLRVFMNIFLVIPSSQHLNETAIASPVDTLSSLCH